MQKTLRLRRFQSLLLILFSLNTFGQLTISGIVRDYHSKEKMQFVSIRIDTLSCKNLNQIPIPTDEIKTDINGSFTLEINNPKLFDLSISYLGYVPLRIKNIRIDNQNQSLDLGNIYIPFLGQWVEGYKRPNKGIDRKTRRIQRKAWKQEGVPNYGCYSNSFIEPFKNKEEIMLEYPPNGQKKSFKFDGVYLIIEYEEFAKTRKE